MSSDEKSNVASPPANSQLIFASWTKDILIYIIVLNLFVEYNPVIVIDSFTISIFTAILLKVLLEVIVWFEHKVAEFFKSRPGPFSKFLRVFFTWIILFLSKFIILEAVDLVFGDHVELGKFLDVILLVIALMVARALVQWIYVSLGKWEETTGDRSA